MSVSFTSPAVRETCETYAETAVHLSYLSESFNGPQSSSHLLKLGGRQARTLALQLRSLISSVGMHMPYPALISAKAEG